ncbi:MAG: TraR/DksA family transcriptional regulator [Magnetospirillum sp.]
MDEYESHKAELLRRLAELDRLAVIGRENTKPVELDQNSVGRLSRMDALQVQAMAQETERRRQTERIRITNALKRIDSGDYGFCLKCDEPIAAKRLALDPAVSMCIGCAGVAESE